jgi:hypothetical protein
MKLAKIAVIFVIPLAVGGCQAMVWGQLSAVVASALIFAGTLALGRATEARAEKASRGGAASSKID